MALLDRRHFLAAAGGAFLSGLHPWSAEAFERTDSLVASTYKDPSGTYGLAILRPDGMLIHQVPLPARGHDTIWHPSRQSLVVFARRPGTFALVVDLKHPRPPKLINAPAGRHFYGHGCFSADGHLLYATENDFEAARGVIGIYDARSDYQRVGEFESFGIGPHDMLHLPDQNLLAVANGGIETHPDYPRAKLNLATMRPNLSLIDAESGTLIYQVELPGHFHKLSIRHLATGKDGDIWFACQNEGDVSRPVPLFGKLDTEGSVELVQLPLKELTSLRGYIGSIAYNTKMESVAVTSPRGGVMIAMREQAEPHTTSMFEPDICGIIGAADGFLHSSGQGRFAAMSYALNWDNHLSLG